MLTRRVASRCYWTLHLVEAWQDHKYAGQVCGTAACTNRSLSCQQSHTGCKCEENGVERSCQSPLFHASVKRRGGVIGSPVNSHTPAPLSFYLYSGEPVWLFHTRVAAADAWWWMRVLRQNYNHAVSYTPGAQPGLDHVRACDMAGSVCMVCATWRAH